MSAIALKFGCDRRDREVDFEEIRAITTVKQRLRTSSLLTVDNAPDRLPQTTSNA